MEHTDTRRRKSARQQKAARKVSSVLQSSKLEKRVSLELVNSSQSRMIHEAVKKILWEVGVIIEHTPSCKQLLRKKDCWQDDQGYVHLPEDLIERAILSVPDIVRLYDHDGNIKVDTNSSISSYCPGHNCVRILDYRTNELRPCSLDDIRETARLCETLPNIDMVCSLGYPSEIPPEDEVVETVRAMYENCSKPAALLAHDEIIQERMLNLIADMTGGWQRMADKPVCLELMGPISPLKMPEELCLRLINCARWRIPAFISG